MLLLAVGALEAVMRMMEVGSNKSRLSHEGTKFLAICVAFLILLGMASMAEGMDANREGGGASGIRPPIFSGKAADWPMFWLQLVSYASFKGFSAALTGRCDPSATGNRKHKCGQQ